MVRERVKASEGEIDLCSVSVIRRHVMRDRDYIRKRLSVQNKENLPQDKTLRDLTNEKSGRGFYFIHCRDLCPILQVRTEEGQSKIINTESVFEASQKNVMIECVEGSA